MVDKQGSEFMEEKYMIIRIELCTLLIHKIIETNAEFEVFVKKLGDLIDYSNSIEEITAAIKKVCDQNEDFKNCKESDYRGWARELYDVFQKRQVCYKILERFSELKDEWVQNKESEEYYFKTNFLLNSLFDDARLEKYNKNQDKKLNDLFDFIEELILCDKNSSEYIAAKDALNCFYKEDFELVIQYAKRKTTIELLNILDIENEPKEQKTIEKFNKKTCGKWLKRFIKWVLYIFIIIGVIKLLMFINIEWITEIAITIVSLIFAYKISKSLSTRKNKVNNQGGKKEFNFKDDKVFTLDVFNDFIFIEEDLALWIFCYLKKDILKKLFSDIPNDENDETVFIDGLTEKFKLISKDELTIYKKILADNFDYDEYNRIQN